MLLLVSLICLPLDQPIALTTFLADLAFNLRLQLWSKLLSSYYTWRPWHEKYGEEQIQFKMWRQPFGRLSLMKLIAYGRPRHLQANQPESSGAQVSMAEARACCINSHNTISTSWDDICANWVRIWERDV
ncbi:hypothetical protein SAY86_019049 [Trapa natans]|uniref:Uncharacterized protein n=1 Tax=Trapa natans TaxID=22666 RepID=A0AAN7R2B8_TRANT|nr:hypothetical protein SAY86_019049 [Trapa natans]